MLNPGAPPFEYNPPPPPPPAYYYYCRYQSHPQPLSLCLNNNVGYHLAAQFSHSISLTTTATEVSQQQQQQQQQQSINVRGRPRNSSTTSCRPSLEFDDSKMDVEIRTTVMIKNIPNKLNRDLLMTLLDQHCAEENCKAAVEGAPLSEYDFVYLPMDFQSKGNLGYAFVNLTTPVAGWRLFRALHGRRWAVFRSGKTAHICYARIQGKEALLDNFRRSSFVCQDDRYLPAVLSPPRNGTTSLTNPAAVGRRMWLRR